MLQSVECEYDEFGRLLFERQIYEVPVDKKSSTKTCTYEHESVINGQRTTVTYENGRIVRSITIYSRMCRQEGITDG